MQCQYCLSISRPKIIAWLAGYKTSLESLRVILASGKPLTMNSGWGRGRRADPHRPLFVGCADRSLVSTPYIECRTIIGLNQKMEGNERMIAV